MLFRPNVTKQVQEIVFLKRKVMEVIQVYTLMKLKYNDNLFKNILISF